MRILIIAFANSIHTARWISQIADQNWEIHFFPSHRGLIHPELKRVILHDSLVRFHNNNIMQPNSIPWPFPGSNIINRVLSRLRDVELARWTTTRTARLNRLIRRIKPDIIHSMETQSAGYLVSQVKQLNTLNFPIWIHTLWGSDIYLYSRLDYHRPKITQMLKLIDFLVCEGERDIVISKKLGFDSPNILKIQATGGFNINLCTNLKSATVLTSKRRFIILKGYQGWAGRSLCGLRALERCVDILSEYTVAIYSTDNVVELAAELFSHSTGIPVQIIPYISHTEMLELQGKARISISLSISDGVPNSMLEAITMGAFPIQSWTACTDDWIKDGVNGILVPPEDPEVIEIAIRKALLDDDLVNIAAEYNWGLIKEQLDERAIKQKTIKFYEQVNKHTSSGDPKCLMARPFL